MSETETLKRPVDFQWIVDRAPISVIITDLDGAIEYVNRHVLELSGYTREELIGKNPRILKSGEHDAAFYRNLWNTVLKGRTWQGILHNRGKSGSRFSERAHIAPFREADGTMTRLVAIKEDLTESLAARVRLEEQGGRLAEALERADQASRAKSEFLGNMSHELRTPLTGIAGLVDILIEEAGDSRRLGHLKLLRETSDRLIRIVNDMLDYSSLAASAPEVVESEIDIDSFLRKTLARFAGSADSRGLELSLRVGRDVPPRLRIDVEKLKQILDRLLDNAVKFTSVGGITLSVETSAPESVYSLEFSVADTGIGVPAADRERIFEPFSRFGSPSDRGEGGTGLGLALAKRLVRLLGGTLWVEDNPAGGATFRCTVEASRPSFDETPKNVLLVEDNRINRLVLRHILEQGGITVVSADSGNDALQMMKKELFDAVLLDVEMPDLGGREVVDAIRGFEGRTGRPRQRIVVLTAHPAGVGNDRAVDSGIDGVVTKPVRSEELLASIRIALRPRSAGPVS
ncbi:MAG: ATP-binding protein [Spirochaetaceae bacterium]